MKKYKKRKDANIPLPNGSYITPEELDIMKLTAAGLGNKEIAGVKYKATATVKNQKTTLFKRMPAINGANAVYKLAKWGIILASFIIYLVTRGV